MNIPTQIALAVVHVTVVVLVVFAVAMPLSAIFVKSRPSQLQWNPPKPWLVPRKSPDQMSDTAAGLVWYLIVYSPLLILMAVIIAVRSWLWLVSLFSA
jgi:hypothetical protein